MNNRSQLTVYRPAPAPLDDNSSRPQHHGGVLRTGPLAGFASWALLTLGLVVIGVPVAQAEGVPGLGVLVGFYLAANYSALRRVDPRPGPRR